MRRLWLKIRLPLAIIALLALTFILVRVFSGPEDTWMRNDQGVWIKHGNPSAPMPSSDYREPVLFNVIPWIFLLCFVLPLFFLKYHKPSNRLTFENVSRDMKFLGYLSTVLPITGLLIVLGLIIESGLDNFEMLRNQEIVFIYSLEGFAGLCILLGAVFFIMKRNCNDHYQLERHRLELLDALENAKIKKD
ncbi:MAG: hypothetical protein M1426_00300 [Patescibacteria group bacterium]|nr:hypothetical protein [Patescibacteria group bacterium]